MGPNPKPIFTGLNKTGADVQTVLGTVHVGGEYCAGEVDSMEPQSPEELKRQARQPNRDQSFDPSQPSNPAHAR